MANTRKKRKITPNGTAPKRGEIDENGIYTTMLGKQVKVHGLSPYLMDMVQAKYERENPEPKPPTYTVPLPGGDDVETHFHDDTTPKTPEVQAQWEQYKRDVDEWEAGQQLVTIKAIIAKGVEFDMPEDDSWAEIQTEILGLDVPTEPLARKIHYFQTEIMGSAQDTMNLMLGSMGMTGMNEEVNEYASRLFHSALSEQTDNSE